MKLYRVVAFLPGPGKVVPINNRLYRTASQAKAMRTRYLKGWWQNSPNPDMVFIQETETEWTKLK